MDNHRESTIFLESQQPQAPDLELKLSLGGEYGEKVKDKALGRSLSVMGLVKWKRDVEKDKNDTPESFLSLSRSCSLPEQEFRTRKRVITLDESNVGEKGLDFTKSLAKLPAAIKSPSSVVERAVTSEVFNLPSTVTEAETLSRRPSHLPLGSDFRREKRARVQDKDKDPIQTQTEMMLRRMPSVTTTGDGPNGRRIEGFLYKYMKGQVCIVCVCHGNFLTPAEFVKHAGGGDVANPMKRINVYMNPLTYG